MRSRASQGSELITKVNVTPIIDVALVLVIILLVTAPLLTTSSLPVNLPVAHTREAEDERNVSVTRSETGELAVGEQAVTPATLRTVLSAELGQPGNEHVLVVIRADSQTPYAAVRGLIRDVRAAGATRIAVATQQSSGVTP